LSSFPSAPTAQKPGWRIVLTGCILGAAAMAVAGCTATSGGRDVTMVAPTFDPPATVRVQEAGGYRIAGTMPPLEVARVANQMQQNGRAVLQPTASIAATCPRVEFYGCVVRTGDRFVIHIDASLPAWASDIFATALFGYAAQMAAGRTPSSAGYLDPPEYLTRSAGRTAGNRPAQIVTYAHVWGGEPPEPYASAARQMLASGAVRVRYLPLAEIERVCGRNRTSAGWIGMACQVSDQNGPAVLIADQVPPAARALIELHEAAHAAGWSGDHDGALKPVGHLDACIRSMAEADLSLRTMRELCNLDAGAPLRTEDERTRWAAMRAGG